MTLHFAKNATFKDVVEDGFNGMKANNCDGFEYIVGTIKGGQLKVVFEPPYSCEMLEIGGPEDFAFTLVSETED